MVLYRIILASSIFFRVQYKTFVFFWQPRAVVLYRVYYSHTVFGVCEQEYSAAWELKCFREAAVQHTAPASHTHTHTTELNTCLTASRVQTHQ